MIDAQKFITDMLAELKLLQNRYRHLVTQQAFATKKLELYATRLAETDEPPRSELGEIRAAISNCKLDQRMHERLLQETDERIARAQAAVNSFQPEPIDEEN